MKDLPLLKGLKTSRPNDSSFLPDDYVARRAERRTNIISVTLFICVMFGVTAAFFVSNKEVRDVKSYQEAINVRVIQAAEQLAQLKALEEVEAELFQKAEVTTALYEKVPRSILMAELVNRMPPAATLLTLELTSKRLDRPVRSTRKKPSDSAKSLSGKASRKTSRKSKGKGKDEDEPPVVTAPRFQTTVEIVGVAPTHEEVAEYHAALKVCPLLSGVDLILTEEDKIQERELVQFRIQAQLRPDADARRITPLESPRDAAPLSRPPGGSWDMGGVIEFLGGGSR